MGAVKNLCKRGIVLNQGQVAFDGGVEEAVGFYTSTNILNSSHKIIINDRDHRDGFQSKDLEITEAEILNADKEHLATNEPIQIRLRIQRNNPSIDIFTLGMHISNQEDLCVGTIVSNIMKCPQGDIFNVSCCINNHTLTKGTYHIRFNIGLKNISLGNRDYDVLKNVLSFSIEYIDKEKQNAYSVWYSNWGNHFLNECSFNIS